MRRFVIALAVLAWLCLAVPAAFAATLELSPTATYSNDVSLGGALFKGAVKRATKAGRGLTDGDRVGIVREAFQRKGNFGLGSATRTEADQLGTDFVGPGFARSRSKPDILISADGLRKYRPPSYKLGRGGYQANLERRFERGGPFSSNGHIDISDP